MITVTEIERKKKFVIGICVEFIYYIKYGVYINEFYLEFIYFCTEPIFVARIYISYGDIIKRKTEIVNIFFMNVLISVSRIF